MAGELAAVTKKREAKAMLLADAMTKMIEGLHVSATATMRAKELGEQAKHMKEEFTRQAELSTDLRHQRDELTKLTTDTKEKARRLKETAEREAPMNEELMNKFKDYPVLVEELEESIRMVENEAGLYKCVMFYYKRFLPPDAWTQNKLVLLNKRLVQVDLQLESAW